MGLRFAVRGSREIKRCMRLYDRVDGDDVVGGVLLFPPGDTPPTLFETPLEAEDAIDRTVTYGTIKGWGSWRWENYYIIPVNEAEQIRRTRKRFWRRR